MNGMKTKIIAVLFVCFALIAIAGCTGLPESFGKSTSSTGELLPHGAIQRSYSDSGNGYSGSGTSLTVPAPVPNSGGLPGQGTDTKIIKTADVTLEVHDVTSAVDTIKNIGVQQGGYVSTTSISKNYNDQLTGTVMLRIPADHFENALSGVKSAGTVKSISTQGQDVTEEYVDVQAQITSYQNQLSQYNEIMKKAVKVQDVIDIQQQIDQVQTNLDRLNGRMKYLNSQIDYSTITITLQEPEPVGGPGGHDFIAAVNEGIAGFFGVIDAIIILVLSLLPIFLIGGAAFCVYRVWRRRQSVIPKSGPSDRPGQK